MKTTTKQQYSVVGSGARRFPAAAVPFILRGRGLLGASFARRLGMAALVALGALTASAQPYAIEWFTIAGGGGESTGGVYSVSGTLGQSAAGGPLSGGAYSLTGGFSSIYAVQTPGAPFLSIERLAGAVRVRWPLPATDYVLDQSPTVTGAWSQVAFPYTTNATDISISVNPAVGNRFYRLRKP